MTYRWYQQHRRSNIEMYAGDNLDDAIRNTFSMAEHAAKLGHDALYRLFGPSGFVLAYSVFGGGVIIHEDVTIPTRHW